MGQTKELKSGQHRAGLKLESTQPRVSPSDTAPSLDKRVEAERQRLFKALSIVECCRLATASLYEIEDSEYMVPAFEVICDLLTHTVDELECIASQCVKVE